MRRRTWLIGSLAAVIGLLAASAWPAVHGLALVARVADLHGVVRGVADLDTRSIHERDVTIPLSGRTLRGRVYQPVGGATRTAVAIAGLHPAGIDEPRMVELARQLAASGVGVVTPEIPELSAFDITVSVTDAIAGVVTWASSDATLAPDGRVGLIGVSVSGGLAIVAAGRPDVRERVAYVFSLGGHADLPRVLRFLCTGAAHDYGVVLLLLTVADRVVPSEQVGPLREALRQFLRASYLERTDTREALRQFAELRASEDSMPEPSRSLLRHVNSRDTSLLGPRLLPHIDGYGDDAALSPSRAPSPTAPVYLLHGRDDNVIPATESLALARILEPHARVRLLLTPLISHADATGPHALADVIALGRFAGALLRE